MLLFAVVTSLGGLSSGMLLMVSLELSSGVGVGVGVGVSLAGWLG
jgi:hypothetical protein